MTDVASALNMDGMDEGQKKEKIENYFMQCTAYAIMYEEIVGVPIEQIVVLIGTENGDGQVFVEEKSNYVESLKKYIDVHYAKQ